jgi:23S rRNA (guanosine2251-2'-O)-methyltransferase
MEDKKEQQLVFGLQPIIEVIREGKSIEKVLIAKNAQHSKFEEIRKAAKEMRFPVQVVPEEKLNRVTKKNHQGVIAFVSQVEYYTIEDVTQTLFDEGKTPFVVVLDQITDVRNFGAICRTAECAGAHAIVIPSKNSASINADAIKTSAGAIFKLKIVREDNLKYSVTYLKQSGLSIVCCTEKATEDYYSTDLKMPVAMVLGSEEYGISPGIRRLADAEVKIPMTGTTQSLNVSVAAGILFFERQRQLLTQSK